VPCYRCGVRQTDPERGASPWRRGVLRDRLVLICPVCQQSGDWTAELDRCARCASTHLISRLGEVECLDCGLVRELALVPGGGRQAQRDDALAEEVGRALDRVLRHAGGSPGGPARRLPEIPAGE